MTPGEFYARLQADALALVEEWREQGCIDLTAGVIDIRDEHDPISAAVLEEDVRDA